MKTYLLIFAAAALVGCTTSNDRTSLGGPSGTVVTEGAGAGSTWTPSPTAQPTTTSTVILKESNDGTK